MLMLSLPFYVEHVLSSCWHSWLIMLRFLEMHLPEHALLRQGIYIAPRTWLQPPSYLCLSTERSHACRLR